MARLWYLAKGPRKAWILCTKDIAAFPGVLLRATHVCNAATMQKPCAESHEKWKKLIKATNNDMTRLKLADFPKKCLIENEDVPTAKLLNLLVDSKQACPGDEEAVNAAIALIAEP
jgi:hypothetical protein